MSGFQRATDFANQAMNVASQARPLVDLIANQFAPRPQPGPSQSAVEPSVPAPPAPPPSAEPTAPEPSPLAAPTSSPPAAADAPSEPAPPLQPMAPPPTPGAPPTSAAAPAVAPAPPPPPQYAQPAPSWPQLAAAMPPGMAPYGFSSPLPVGPAAPPGWVDPRLFAAALMSANPYAQPSVATALPAWPAPGAGSPVTAPPMSSVADLMLALQTGAIPRVSGLAPMPGRGFGAPPTEPRAARPARDATALLSMLLSNAQVQDALRRAAVQPTPDNVQLTLPARVGSERRDVVPLPMDAVVQAIAALANRSRLELDESAADEADGAEAPREFLLSESGDLLVDPADPDRRADLVVHYFRCAAQVERGGL